MYDKGPSKRDSYWKVVDPGERPDLPMIELTDLQEDILALAVEQPDLTNRDIAEVLDCSEDWVGEVRNKYEPKVDENQIDPEEPLNTVDGTPADPPDPSRSTEWDDKPEDISKGAALIAAGLCAWGAALFLTLHPDASTEVEPGTIELLWWISGLWTLVFPVGIFLDAQFLHSHDAPWKPNRVVWPVIGFVVIFIGPLVYGVRRFTRTA